MSFFDISYSVIQPFPQNNFISDWQNCLTQIITLVKDNHYRIFKINIFVHSTDIVDFRTKKQLITDSLLSTFLEECPTFGISANSPEKQFNIEVEIGIVVFSSEMKIAYRRYSGWRYTIIEKNKYKELWVNGIAIEFPTMSIKTASVEAFEIMRLILLAENMTFDNIVRQWNYIGRILNTFQYNSTLVNNYQLFNEVRHDFYRRYRLIPGFPAATGVGMNYNMVMIDFYAISTFDEMQIISIKNPNQINPYDYSQEVLFDKSFHKQSQKQPPLFERAILLIFHDKWRLLVSGTASIIGQETTAKGDLLEQTMVTIGNIEKLTCRENLVYHFPQLIYKVPKNTAESEFM